MSGNRKGAAMSGAAYGASLGVIAGGPLGALIGAAIGSVVIALAGGGEENASQRSRRAEMADWEIEKRRAGCPPEYFGSGHG
jgi:uncharacterized protein YcfJ